MINFILFFRYFKILSHFIANEQLDLIYKYSQTLVC